MRVTKGNLPMKLKIAADTSDMSTVNQNDHAWIQNFIMASQPSTVTNTRVTTKGISLGRPQ